MRVLVIEDDDAVRAAVRRALLLGGYEVLLAADGQEGLLKAGTDGAGRDRPRPRPAGHRRHGGVPATAQVGNRTPILMLTARDAVEDRVDGLEAGADDYLVKPYDVRELQARLKAIMRRHVDGRDGRSLRFGELELDADAHAARIGERSIELTRTEYQLLELLMLNPRRVLSSELIYDRIWGYDFALAGNALRVYIGYLRRKLEAGGGPRLIQTVHGVGLRAARAVSLRRRIAAAAALAVAAVAVMLAAAATDDAIAPDRPGPAGAVARSRRHRGRQRAWAAADQADRRSAAEPGGGPRACALPRRAARGRRRPAAPPLGGAPAYFQFVYPDGRVVAGTGGTPQLPVDPGCCAIARTGHGSFYFDRDASTAPTSRSSPSPTR